MIEIRDSIGHTVPVDDSSSKTEQLFLYALIRAIKPKVVVEIGTHRGLTALYMAAALHENGEGILHTTDPFEYGQEEHIGKHPELKRQIMIHKKRGKDLDVSDVDFLFVDGFHEKEHVLAEMAHFMPRLSKKAVVIFHDCWGDNEMVGVNEAIEKLGLRTAFIPTDNAMRIYGHANDTR